MRERYRCRHGNHVATEERQFHPGLALGHAVAHGWNTSSHLTYSADLMERFFDHRGVSFKWLVGRKHIVEGGHNAYVESLSLFKAVLIGSWARREPMSQIPA